VVNAVCPLIDAFERDDVLSEKIEQLTEWSLKRPVIRLNFDKFKHYVKSAPRNYTMAVMLTALNAQRDCKICKAANDEFQVVAQSWRYSAQFSSKLFFAMVDFDDAPDVFKMLNTASAPQFILFGRKGKPKASDNLDIARVGFSSEQMAKWIGDRADIQIKIFRPPNYSGLLLIALLIFMIGGLLYVKRNNLEFLYNRTTWSIVVISLVLVFISGQMWNQIRGPPLVHRNPKNGQIGFFAGGYGYQFVAETYIVAALYGSIVIGTILMIEAPKHGLNEKTKKKVMAISGIAMVVVFFSMILSIFRSKYQGYPYSFLF